MLNAPRRDRPDSDVDDALPTLSASDCAAEAAADAAPEVLRDHRFCEGGSVEADSVNNGDCCADSPEAVFEDMASLEGLGLVVRVS